MLQLPLPYSEFLYFAVLLLYVVIPTTVLGLWGKAGSRWTLLVTLGVLPFIFVTRANDAYPELRFAVEYALLQVALAYGLLKWPSKWNFYLAIALSISPLVISKFYPLVGPENATTGEIGVVGFIGISYVTFRSLDVLFSIRDRVITSLNLKHYLAYVFFFPTISSGPIDRYRRFGQDLNRVRGRHEFLEDLDAAVQRVFQGFLYKFLIAALLKTYWVDPSAKHLGALHTWSYMYAYTFYLFFDFAGYTAFAIGIGRLFGIRSPENFNLPFLSRNIRDFWNRWHMSLSFWFRDHIYMRFLLTAAKGKWFKGKHTSSYIGLFLTFGIMGIWHGPERYYIIYGLYHATLLCGYDIFARWNKQAKVWKDGPWWRAGNVLLTFHAFAFGLLIFSGRLTPKAPPKHEEILEMADCDKGITGWVWDSSKPNEPLTVDLFVDDIYVGSAVANELREEKKTLGYGNGAHAFTFKFQPGTEGFKFVHDGHPHIVDAKINIDPKVKGTGRRLRNAPEQLTCHHE